MLALITLALLFEFSIILRDLFGFVKDRICEVVKNSKKNAARDNILKAMASENLRSLKEDEESQNLVLSPQKRKSSGLIRNNEELPPLKAIHETRKSDSSQSISSIGRRLSLQRAQPINIKMMTRISFMSLFIYSDCYFYS